MSRKSRENKARREAEAAGTAATEAPVFETVGQANEALSEVAKVVNMRERKREKEKKAAAATGKTKSGLGKLPTLAKKRVFKPKPERPCACGCDQMTKSRFTPGHDSRLKALVLRVERKVMTLAEIEKFGGKKQRQAVEAEMRGTKPGSAKAAKGKKAKAVKAVPVKEEAVSEAAATGA